MNREDARVHDITTDVTLPPHTEYTPPPPPPHRFPQCRFEDQRIGIGG